jgi:chorismate--pyruvate lyase
LLPLDLWAPGVEVLRALPPVPRGWLTETGLLTDRITGVSGAAVGHRLVDQRLGFLSRDEQVQLAAPAASCLVHEIVLTGRGQPWIFVQSLIPDHTLELHPWLAELGDSSLGATLGGIAALTRGAFEFATLPAAHPLAARALASLATDAGGAWARRCWYGLRGRRLMVQEVFRPELVPC